MNDLIRKLQKQSEFALETAALETAVLATQQSYVASINSDMSPEQREERRVRAVAAYEQLLDYRASTVAYWRDQNQGEIDGTP